MYVWLSPGAIFLDDASGLISLVEVRTDLISLAEMCPELALDKPALI